MKKRTAVPAETMRALLVECGFRCSVPKCDAQWPTLHFHHIDENPSNNAETNLLVLCPTHHQMATSRHIDRKHCELLKKLLADFSSFEASPESERRNSLLRCLMTEVHMNLETLKDPKFEMPKPPRVAPVMYPRLLHASLDQALSSGLFIQAHDRELLAKLYAWNESLTQFNRCFDVTEKVMFVVGTSLVASSWLPWLGGLRARAVWRSWHRSAMEGGQLRNARKQGAELWEYLVKHYAEQIGLQELIDDANG